MGLFGTFLYLDVGALTTGMTRGAAWAWAAAVGSIFIVVGAVFSAAVGIGSLVLMVACWALGMSSCNQAVVKIMLASTNC